MDLNKPNFLSRNPKWAKRAAELIEHGLGLMSPEQHEYLVKQGMINCNNENDSIVADYPKLKIKNKRGEDEYIDLNGNLELLEQEMIHHNNSRIVYFPKKYSEYLDRKNKSWKQDEEEALAALITQGEPD